MTLAELREEVFVANQSLPKAGLVTMHSGNASGYDPDTDTVLIKPSGMDYEKLTPASLVAVTLVTGDVHANQLRPSVDLSHHLFLYRNMLEIRGIVHTHSNYATAFAAAHKCIPLALTAIADEFGAVMVEDVAKTIYLAQQLGDVVPIPPEEAEKWYDRYQNRYGQK
jgi:L-ribulose-5-phosphate 4-epimerase